MPVDASLSVLAIIGLLITVAVVNAWPIGIGRKGQSNTGAGHYHIKCPHCHHCPYCGQRVT